MSEWQPIETYDMLKKKPKLALFRFKPEISERTGQIRLPEAIEKSRYFGCRIATHWIEIPELPKPEKDDE